MSDNSTENEKRLIGNTQYRSGAWGLLRQLVSEGLAYICVFLAIAIPAIALKKFVNEYKKWDGSDNLVASGLEYFAYFMFFVDLVVGAVIVLALAVRLIIEIIK